MDRVTNNEQVYNNNNNNNNTDDNNNNNNKNGSSPCDDQLCFRDGLIAGAQSRIIMIIIDMVMKDHHFNNVATSDHHNMRATNQYLLH